MSQELTVTSSPPHAHSTHTIWLAALIQPSVATYKRLSREPRASTRRACTWMFAGGLVGGAIDSVELFVTQLVERSYLDILLLALIPVSAIIAMGSVVAFAWCTQ